MGSIGRYIAFVGLFGVLSSASCQQAEDEDIDTAAAALGGQCNIQCRDGTQLVRTAPSIGSNSGVGYLMGYMHCRGEMECASHGGHFGASNCFYYP